MLRLSVIASSVPLTVKDIVLVSMVQLALIGLEGVEGFSLANAITMGMKCLVGNTIRRFGGKNMALIKKVGKKADLAKKLSKQEGFEDAAFVFLAGTGNQPNAYVRGARKDSYLSQKNPGDYVFFSEQVFSSSKAKYVAYKCNIESNVPEGMLGYALSDVQAGMVNPVF